MTPTQNYASCARLSPADRALIKVLILGVLLPLLDTTLIYVALHRIGEQLGSPLSSTQWVATAYTLAAASSVALSSYLIARMGARKLWVYCLVLFLCGACLSAMAQNVEFLIFARVLQGLATGVLLPTMQTIVVNAIGAEKLQLALSAMSIPTVLAPIFGPLIGSLILQFLDWRWLFGLHVPICLVAIVLALQGVPNFKAGQTARFDWLGFFLLSPSLLLMVYGISQMGEKAIEARVFLALGLGLLLVFAWRAVPLKANSIVDINLFRGASFRASCALLFFSSVIYYGGIVLLPLYLIQVGGYGAPAAGLFLALHGVGTLLARYRLAAITRLLGDRRTAYAAILLTLLGSALLFPRPLLELKAMVAAAMLLRGAGVGILTIVSMSAAYQGLTQQQVAQASALTRMLTHLGATIGAATVLVLAASADGTARLGDEGYAAPQIALVLLAVVCGPIARKLPSRRP